MERVNIQENNVIYNARKSSQGKQRERHEIKERNYPKLYLG